MRVSILALVLLGGVAAADSDTFEALQKSLPTGWTVLETEHELVIRHDRPCYVVGQHRPNEPGKANPCTEDGPLVTLELRFHVEPRWTAKQLDEAKLANEKIAAELKASREKYRIDAIHQSKGRALPGNADERKRLSAYEKDEAQLKARTVKTPLCTLGDSSLFDGDQTYAQLKLKIDPPEASLEASKVLETLKKMCGAV
jgi:hypothetical protein